MDAQERRSVADKLEVLFDLKESDFRPEEHFKIADEIVTALSSSDVARSFLGIGIRIGQGPMSNIRGADRRIGSFVVTSWRDYIFPVSVMTVQHIDDALRLPNQAGRYGELQIFHYDGKVEELQRAIYDVVFIAVLGLFNYRSREPRILWRKER